MDIEVYNLLLGMFLPIPISFIKAIITKPNTPKWVVYLIAFIVSILCGIGSVYASGGEITDVKSILISSSVIIAASQTIYKLIIKEAGIDSKITEVLKK